mmetsp:Transcript_2554/g.3621  ORF Transcript_2554/g.3621 Transcript_2554/m.3621 type:complete len:707 (-) Transcript_2554:246-2366(-)|eukprot:CAMPEP_0184858740 /NCGR_PEP_ID=MMETSP0580-20130426/3809_1 /TAXON_ID=1118495 /ORGANISM="Dactyliosolen fragilissimus" /LENGTH=706 /DNA_ID=CAMNT_0027355043 /DNA_START=26 /DNA_END=2146 /DNA_ORIENTATION=-
MTPLKQEHEDATISKKVKKEKKKKKSRKQEQHDEDERKKESSPPGGNEVNNKKKKKAKKSQKGDREEQSKKVRKKRRDIICEENAISSSIKRRKIDDDCEEQQKRVDKQNQINNIPKPQTSSIKNNQLQLLPFAHGHVLAPMVGASELAFRLLCRKYGATLAYTPMMSSTKFASCSNYRREEFQTIPEDRPLVCHFSANNPSEFASAAKLVEDRCDAIDLNLGCPQRTAYVGHFGSYLLGPEDRELVVNIVRAGAQAVSIPIFCKIRLLDKIEDTIELCKQLRDAGASLIAIHGRYRASFERDGPGARDGPAMLDQIRDVKAAMGGNYPILTNGNVITYEDVVNNQLFTSADGVMSAEGILDNPALFLPRYFHDKHDDIDADADTDTDTKNENKEHDRMITIADPSPLITEQPEKQIMMDSDTIFKRKRKLAKKLREIQTIEKKASETKLTEEQQQKLKSKTQIQKEYDELQNMSKNNTCTSHTNTKECTSNKNMQISKPKSKLISIRELREVANDPIKLANEYLDLVQKYPVQIRSVVFHTRRICKDLLNKYQLMDECVNSDSPENIRKVLKKIDNYRSNPSTFTYDMERAQREKDLLERRKREEGKRKAFEARMIRRAKREGLKDKEHYLRIGAVVPTIKEVTKLKELKSKAEQMIEWKNGNHGQHCMSFHIDSGGCQRDRTCAFLHVDAHGEHSFVEADEVAG